MNVFNSGGNPTGQKFIVTSYFYIILDFEVMFILSWLICVIRYKDTEAKQHVIFHPYPVPDRFICRMASSFTLLRCAVLEHETLEMNNE